MINDSWRDSYDSWKTHNPDDDYWDGEVEDGCTCPLRVGAGGYRLTDEWCPLHGRDPDAEYDKMRNEQ